jgi:hypothetical protein
MSPAVSPTTPRRLKMFDPTTFSTAISCSRRKTATTLVATSGRLVPVATIVVPIAVSVMPMFSAMLTAPRTA